MSDLKKRVKGRYIYLNPLLLSKTFNKDKCIEATIRSPVLCLGAYSFKSLYKLDQKEKNCREDAYKDFKTLENNCIIILNQLKTYQKMMAELNVKENSDLDDQTRQKIRFIGELLNIIRNNILLNGTWRWSSAHCSTYTSISTNLKIKFIHFYNLVLGNLTSHFITPFLTFYIYII